MNQPTVDLEALGLENPAEHYSHGGCHELAVALHRKLGWDMVVVTQPEEPYWEDEGDPDNSIPCVVHVYAVDPAGNAWDILGSRPSEQVRQETQERFLVGNLDTDWLRSEGELTVYVGEWGDPDPIDRPLFAYTDEDVERAWRDARKALAHLPGWSETPARRGPKP